MGVWGFQGHGFRIFRVLRFYCLGLTILGFRVLGLGLIGVAKVPRRIPSMVEESSLNSSPGRGSVVVQYVSGSMTPVPWAQRSFETDLLHLGTGSTRS